MLPDVWAIWPSANPDLAEKTAQKWNFKGYQTAVLIDKTDPGLTSPTKVLVGDEWRGYGRAMNRLCREVPAEVVVCISDDIEPSEVPPNEIFIKFLYHFPDLLGVMQPTGDRYGSIDKCCVCPWIGRTFIDEAYGGKGPFFEEYSHYFTDEELQEVATKLDAFVQFPDISQFHDHWSRNNEARPQHLLWAKDKWQKDHDLFELRQKKGFPGHERLS